MMAWECSRAIIVPRCNTVAGKIEKPRLVGLGYRSVKQTITKHLKSFAASQLAINNFTFHSS